MYKSHCSHMCQEDKNPRNLGQEQTLNQSNWSNSESYCKSYNNHPTSCMLLFEIIIIYYLPISYKCKRLYWYKYHQDRYQRILLLKRIWSSNSLYKWSNCYMSSNYRLKSNKLFIINYSLFNPNSLQVQTPPLFQVPEGQVSTHFEPKANLELEQPVHVIELLHVEQ